VWQKIAIEDRKSGWHRPSLPRRAGTFMLRHPCLRKKWPSFVPKLAPLYATSLWQIFCF